MEWDGAGVYFESLPPPPTPAVSTFPHAGILFCEVVAGAP